MAAVRFISNALLWNRRKRNANDNLTLGSSLASKYMLLEKQNSRNFSKTVSKLEKLEAFFGTNWSIYPSDVNSRQMFDGFPV